MGGSSRGRYSVKVTPEIALCSPTGTGRNPCKSLPVCLSECQLLSSSARLVGPLRREGPAISKPLSRRFDREGVVFSDS